MLNLHTEHSSNNPASNLKAISSADNSYVSLKLYNRESDLLAIHEAAKLAGRTQSPDCTINGMLRMMSQMLGLNRGRVLLPENDQLSIRYSYGLTRQEQERGVYMLGEGITGKVMSSGQLVVIENVDEEPGLLFRAVNRSTLPNEVVAYIALPILDGNTPIGVLGCHRIRARMRPIDADLQILRTFATLIGQALKIHRLMEDEKERTDTNPATNFCNSENQTIVGRSAAIQSVLEQVEQVANANATVLLTGESGTGKERFARLIHTSSARETKPFIAINCAAIPEQLLEAELFGHERGAFTGAISKKAGKFELADGGTLFLDEIGDLDAGLQTKLLRVLETRSVQRVGGAKDIPVDVRIIVATHKNLMDEVNKGQFRLDLFYRLNVFPIHLPALRHRRGDISLLAQHFLKAAKKEYKHHASFEKGALERLDNYQWPGNIRQLENVIKRAVLMSKDRLVSKATLESILASESRVNINTQDSGFETFDTTHTNDRSIQSTPAAESKTSSQCGRRPYNWVDQSETAEIREALERARGNKTRAAELLGMTARQFRYRLKKLDV